MDKYLEEMEGKKIVVFGTGSGAERLMRNIDCELSYCVDNDQAKWGKEFMGIIINNPLLIKSEDKNKLFILVASSYYQEISKQLQEMSLIENVHFVNVLAEPLDYVPIKVRRGIQEAGIVLDIGCGIRPQTLIKPKVHICCEPFKQYTEYLQEHIESDKDTNYVLINSTWGEATQIFPSKSVDTIVLLDVIEHLEKEEAKKLLAKSESIARKQIVIYTPFGFMPQEHPDGKDAWGLDGGKWQEHKSGWLPGDFDNSWNVYVQKLEHTHDNLGRKFEEAYDALWCIKNLGS